MSNFFVVHYGMPKREACVRGAYGRADISAAFLNLILLLKERIKNGETLFL